MEKEVELVVHECLIASRDVCSLVDVRSCGEV